MKNRILGILLFATTQQVWATTPQEVADDLVLHYDQAVVLGTSNPEYIKGQQERLGLTLGQYLTEQRCGDIDLYSCAFELLCNGQIPISNLRRDLLPCD